MLRLLLRMLCTTSALVVSLTPTAAAQALPRVIIQTEQGNLEVEVDSIRAPVTSANFLRYVDLGYYKFGRFYRTVRADNQPDNRVKIEVIQAGLEPLKVKEFPPIPLERTNVTKLSHLDGTVSMARAEPNTATAEFFICVGNQPQLDFRGRRNPDGQGFAAFGRVILGMDIVRRIHQSPARGQQLTPPVRILGITRKQ
jgi:peptidyl-prolyl cis-trans isomerase A (cyclophilin A)